ncbi:hypothetical protein AGMMS50230_06700 [Spirochaetia bacterium]|nr:hypothetical protein AGMMS50230_06700 [Spirochaetia bacterium]
MKRRFFVMCLAVLLGACTALAEKSGTMLDRSAFAEKTLERYKADGLTLQRVQYREGGEGFILTLDNWPTLRFYFTAGEADGTIYARSYTFLSTSVSGWNEMTMDLAGNGTITENPGGECSFIPGALETRFPLKLETRFPLKLETMALSKGRIRRFDTRLGGDEAMTALRNRGERIGVLVEWMTGQTVSAGTGTNGKASFASQKTFEQYWKPILFPELVSAKKRPAAYSVNSPSDWVRGEDVRWNSAYTAGVFPEALQALRDSGTLLRDWEEAAAWIYLVYEWDNIVQTISGETIFVKAK